MASLEILANQRFKVFGVLLIGTAQVGIGTRRHGCRRAHSRSGLSTASSSASSLSRRRSISSRSLGPGFSSRRLIRCCLRVRSIAMLVIAGVSSACWYISLNPMLLWRGNKAGDRWTLGLRPRQSALSIRAKLSTAAAVPRAATSTWTWGRCGLGKSAPREPRWFRAVSKPMTLSRG